MKGERLRTTIAMFMAVTCAAAPAFASAMVPDSCLPKPSAEDIDRLAPFYPAQAKAAGKEGTATLSCGRSEHGRLINCLLSDESPTGFGFGDAALKLAEETRDNPRTRMNSAFAISRPITFRFTLAEPFVSPNVFSQNWGQPTVIQRPDWAEKPSASQFAAAYPRRLFGGNPPGRVVLKCVVGLFGSADCTVLEEAPLDRGFGAAALKVSEAFKFRPLLVDGHACAGGEVMVPINFTPPG